MIAAAAPYPAPRHEGDGASYSPSPSWGGTGWGVWFTRDIAVILAATVLGWILLLSSSFARANDSELLDRLIAAYPEQLAGRSGSVLLWRDGTAMDADDGRPDKTAAEALENGSLLDQLRPDPADPGRIRNRAFFDKLYGDCHDGSVTPNLVRVVWLPKTYGRALQVTSVAGVAGEVAAISRELDELPEDEKRFAYPPGGTYACRTVAHTDRPSMHAWGAAIDINTSLTSYWAWGGKRRDVPASVTNIFRRHGFIWGGDWAHFDTMHFEYRPELLPDYVASRSSAASNASPIPVVPTAVQPGAITSGVRRPDASTSVQARSTNAASSDKPNE